MKNTKKRALEIERSIIDGAINHNSLTGIEAFRAFLSTGLSKYEYLALKDIVETALQAPFADRHKPINALVCRAVEWQAERLAKLEEE